VADEMDARKRKAQD